MPRGTLTKNDILAFVYGEYIRIDNSIVHDQQQKDAMRQELNRILDYINQFSR